MGIKVGILPHYIPSGWWYTYPSEKYELVSQLGLSFPTYGKSKKCSIPATSDSSNSIVIRGT
jgi:hypothetical protein